MDELLLCPNGHVNQPGANYCAVCLLPLKTADEQPGDQTPAAVRGGSVSTTSRAVPTRDWSSTTATRYSRYLPAAPLPAPAPPPPSPAVAEAVPVAPPVTKPKGRRRWPWVLLAGLILLMLLAACALLVFFFPLRVARQTLESTVNRAATEQAAVIAGEPATPTRSIATATESGAGVAGAAVTAVATQEEPTSTRIIPTETPPPTATPFPTITPLPTETPIVGVVLPPPTAIVAGPPEAGAINLLQNGEFTRDWADGWTREANELSGGDVIEVRRLTDDVPVRGLWMEKAGAGSLALVQHVVLADSIDNTLLRGRLRLNGSGATGVGQEGRSALLILYEAADGRQLGATALLDGSADASNLWGNPPLPEPSSSFAYEFLPPDEWQSLDIVLGQALRESLPDVDADAVRQITVMLLLLSDDACAADACRAVLEAAGLQVISLPPGN